MKLRPVLHTVFPSFIVVHYTYILFLIIICSIIIYPQRKFPYIDALFFATGACTQGGLNTVDMTTLTLYQQIIIYLFCMVTTPIFIHGSLVVLRLYWFEKSFKDIKESSKTNFRMRRTATLAATRSLDSGVDQLENGTTSSSDKGIAMQDFAAPYEGHSPLSIDRLSSPETDSEEISPTREPQQRDIKFGQLPHPRRANEVNPQDMYMSIALLQKNRGGADSDSESGPALKIGGPAEREPNKSMSLKRRPSLGIRMPKALRSKLQGEESERSSDDDSESEGHSLNRAQSNIAFPSKNTAGNVKFCKRSETLDVNPGRRKMSLATSPTFDKLLQRRKLRPSISSRWESEDEEDGQPPKARPRMSTNYLSWTPTVGRNSTFVDLSQQQKEELGGVEYRAIKLLIKILLAYYIGFHLIGAVVFAPYINERKSWAARVEDQGIVPTWWGFFTSASAFNDLGLTLTIDSMFQFATNIFVLLWMSFFIVIGNTGFPILLRFIIWILFQLSRPLSQFKESAAFLLDHPRRCFTLLFPSLPTWWLFVILVVLNAVDLVLFIILDWHSAAVSGLAAGYKVLDGLFQAFCTRTAGFSAISIGALHPAVQVSYMIMMYISVLPLAISIRRTNVYEEQSLGVYASGEDDKEDESTPRNFIGAHLRRQLSFDLWFVFLGLFIICITEGGKLKDGDVNFTVFHILFEVISAYGTVGLSLGYPGTQTSLSARFSVLGKLVIIAMMFRGRHRGLPYSLDRAIILPSQKMMARDDIQNSHAIRRSESNAGHSMRRGSTYGIRRMFSHAFDSHSVNRPSSQTFREPFQRDNSRNEESTDNRNGKGNGKGNGNENENGNENCDLGRNPTTGLDPQEPDPGSPTHDPRGLTFDLPSAKDYRRNSLT